MVLSFVFIASSVDAFAMEELEGVNIKRYSGFLLIRICGRRGGGGGVMSGSGCGIYQDPFGAIVILLSSGHAFPPQTTV